MLRRTATSLAASTTPRRYLSTHAHTLYSPTPDLLEKHLASLPSPPTTSASIYLLSTSLPPQTLQPLISALQSALPSSIGAFATSQPGSEPSLALASVEHARTFRTALSGRPKAEVGRYQRPGADADPGDERGSVVGEVESIRREEGWAGMWKGQTGVREVEELKGVSAEAFLLISDGLPRPVLQGLDAMYPQASKIGLLSAPTPFLTGRPHTLIHGTEIHSTGTVGLAVQRSRIKQTANLGLKPLTDAFTIATAQGNLLLTIEEGSRNPTQTLMAAIAARDAGALANKEEEFFLRLGETGERTIKILSGDPSRGALSLDMEDALLVGQKVQFMQRDGTGPVRPLADTLTFSALRRSEDVEEMGGEMGRPRVVEGFLGCGEDGIMVGSSVCAVPNASASWYLGGGA